MVSVLFWLVGPLTALVVVRVALTGPVRRRLAPWLRRLRSLLAQPEDPDLLAEEYARYRIMRLRWMDDRLRCLAVLLDDDTLPATRQIGVRLAYRRLAFDAAALTAQLGAAALDPYRHSGPPDPDTALASMPAERTIHEEMVFS